MNKWFPGTIKTESDQVKGGNFESLLDLFTLLSFAMIIAAFAYTTQQSSQNINNINVEAYISGSSSGSPQTIPQDLLLVIVYNNQGIDNLMIIEGSKQARTYEIRDKSNINKILDNLLTDFQGAKKINLVMHAGNSQPDPSILLSIQLWLSSNGLNKFKIYFTGNYHE